MKKVIDFNSYKRKKKRNKNKKKLIEKNKKKFNISIGKTPYTDNYMIALNGIKQELDNMFDKK